MTEKTNGSPTHGQTRRRGTTEIICEAVFNREALEVDKAEDKIQLTTFKAGLKSK